MDKGNLICTGPALDMFCNLELYADDDTLEIDLLLFKHFVVKKWIIPKHGLVFVWDGYKKGSNHYQWTNSYLGFMLYDGNFIILPMATIRWNGDYDKDLNKSTIELYRNIVEQVLSTNAVGIDGSEDYGMHIKYKGRSFEISDAKKYKKWLSQIYNETKQPGDTPEDVCVRMKANNIQGKLLDKLQNEGFLYSRKYTWDKVYKREDE